jgi:hypothetical protein
VPGEQGHHGQHGPCLPRVRRRRRVPRPAEQRDASPYTRTGWRHKCADPAPRRRPQHMCGRASRSWPSPRQCSAARAWPGGLRTHACDIASMARSTGHRRCPAASRAHVLTVLQARSQQRRRVESTAVCHRERPPSPASIRSSSLLLAILGNRLCIIV